MKPSKSDFLPFLPPRTQIGSSRFVLLVPIVSQTFGTFQSLRHFFRKFSKTAEKRLFSCPFAQSGTGGTHRTAKEAGSPIGPSASLCTVFNAAQKRDRLELGLLGLDLRLLTVADGNDVVGDGSAAVEHALLPALQNQLNPHFLFNSLNTLIAEIEYNPSNAVRFTKHLSSVYRYVLQSQDKTLVPLNEELDFMKSYLFLHEVRLGNCISCECLVPDDYSDAMLPPLTLQLLVENVIKHNSITSGKPMRIHINIENNYLIVSNPIQPKKSNDSSSGVGLNNLSNRCKLMLGEEIIVIKENNSFTVKVPLGYE